MTPPNERVRVHAADVCWHRLAPAVRARLALSLRHPPTRLPRFSLAVRSARPSGRSQSNGAGLLSVLSHLPGPLDFRIRCPERIGNEIDAARSPSLLCARSHPSSGHYGTLSAAAGGDDASAIARGASCTQRLSFAEQGARSAELHQFAPENAIFAPRTPRPGDGSSAESVSLSRARGQVGGVDCSAGGARERGNSLPKATRSCRGCPRFERFL